MYFTTNYSPFDFVYGFNPLTPLDLIHLCVYERVRLNSTKKAQAMQDLHVKIQQQIKRKK